jgi:uncharacterized membrane protein YeaQ/YmgE (transglycosylase-associated protein family)
MDFSITLGLGGWTVLIVGALIFGVIAQYIGETETGYEWLVDGIGFAIGALVVSEFITGFRAVQPVWDELALIPALAGGLVLGIVADVVTRLSTGGTYTTHHRPISA